LLDMQDFLPFLYRGLTFEYLSCSGKAPTAIDWLHKDFLVICKYYVMCVLM
jgi:hypothetical protein